MNAFTVKWYIKFITSLLGYTPELKKALKMKKTQTWKEYKPFVDKNVREWLIPLIDMADVNFVVKGKELVPENEPIIYTPNHASMFDIPAVFLNAPTMPMFIAKKELSAFPFLKQWMWVLDCVFVDRKNKDGARSSLHDAIEMVKNGRSLVIFPEGTRSKNGQLGKFKGGAMKIAMETGAKVVPVLIEGSRERLEATGNITPGTVYVTFLDPIETKGLTKDDFFKMPDEIRELLQKERDNAKNA
jgi:1-acyl-sn-glycerol-3-phosphate acyltransferase